MPDIFYLITKWWKQIFALVLVSVITVGVIVFLQPQKYLSVATALPANSALADKSRIFNNNLEGLYSSLGDPDELDRVLGTAHLDTLYLAVTDSFNLWDHYKVSDEELPRFKSMMLLKKNSRIIKSDYGELKVKVWDTDKNLAPELANALMQKLNNIHQDIQNESNKITLNSLQSGKERLQRQADSIKNIPGQEDLSRQLYNQSQQYETLISEYQLMIDTKSPVLMVVENARPAAWPDKPKRLLMLVATGFLSFLFALLLALLFERRKRA